MGRGGEKNIDVSDTHGLVASPSYPDQGRDPVLNWDSSPRHVAN